MGGRGASAKKKTVPKEPAKPVKYKLGQMDQLNIMAFFSKPRENTKLAEDYHINFNHKQGNTLFIETKDIRKTSKGQPVYLMSKNQAVFLGSNNVVKTSYRGSDTGYIVKLSPGIDKVYTYKTDFKGITTPKRTWKDLEDIAQSQNKRGKPVRIKFLHDSDKNNLIPM